MVNKWPQNLRFLVKNLLILAYLRGNFYQFRSQKSRLDFFIVVLDLFGKSLGILLGLKRPLFSEFLAPKVDK